MNVYKRAGELKKRTVPMAMFLRAAGQYLDTAIGGEDVLLSRRGRICLRVTRDMEAFFKGLAEAGKS